ncbi:hypothetical protein ABZ671_24470 [Micromonospora sp. NPDC006766]|uniref:hypothetical protein n=1 Tax=Micromonospora sp. NPDC006766 TaxID=3154778 RepID=UPI0033DB2CFC
MAALLVYRRRISALLGAGLRRFKAGPLEAEWEAVAEEARVSIEAATVAEASTAAEAGTPTEFKIRHSLQIARDVTYSPAVSASLVRMALEEALTALLPPEYAGRAITLKQLLLEAREVGGLSGAAFVVGAQVLTLANRAVHGDPPTPQQMMELVDLTEDFLALLPGNQKRDQPPSRLPSTRPSGERAADRPATSRRP